MQCYKHTFAFMCLLRCKSSLLSAGTQSTDGKVASGELFPTQRVLPLPSQAPDILLQLQ